jgi:hypothetical protein
MSAAAELDVSPKLRNEFRSDVDAFSKMIVGTEDGLGKFQFRAQLPESLRTPECRYPRIREEFRKMLEHNSRTGHMALLGTK